MPKDCSCFMQMIDYNSTGLVQIFTKTGINNGLWMPYKCTKFQLGLDHSTDSSQIWIQPVNRFFFFENQYIFACTFLKKNFDTTVTWHSKHASKRDLTKIKCTSSGNLIYWLLNDSCFHSLQHVEGTGVERRQWTAVVHSCQIHVDEQWLATSAVGSIPA